MGALVWSLVVPAVVAFVLAPIVLFFWGRRLPAEHEASRTMRLDARPEAVFALLTDVRAIPRWRKTVRSVQQVAGSPHVRFRERGAQGTLELEIAESAPPTRLVFRTVPVRRMVFSGSWTYELVPDDDGTRVTLTERGTVYSPIARLFAARVLGHGTHVERTLASLRVHFSKR